MKWDAVNNPLLAESKAPNVGIAPSFDIDTTGFVKNGIKIADLKGKSLTLITSIRYSTFQYRGEKGENYNEWGWFDALKKTYGLNLKYIESRFDKSVQHILKLLDHFGHGAGEVTQERFGFVNDGGILRGIGGFFGDEIFTDIAGGLDGHFDGFRVDPIDMVRYPNTGGDRKKQDEAEDQKFQTKIP